MPAVHNLTCNQEKTRSPAVAGMADSWRQINQSSWRSRSSNEIRCSITSMDPSLTDETPHTTFTVLTFKWPIKVNQSVISSSKLFAREVSVAPMTALEVAHSVEWWFICLQNICWGYFSCTSGDCTEYCTLWNSDFLFSKISAGDNSCTNDCTGNRPHWNCGWFNSKLLAGDISVATVVTALNIALYSQAVYNVQILEMLMSPFRIDVIAALQVGLTEILARIFPQRHLSTITGYSNTYCFPTILLYIRQRRKWLVAGESLGLS